MIHIMMFSVILALFYTTGIFMELITPYQALMACLITCLVYVVLRIIRDSLL